MSEFECEMCDIARCVRTRRGRVIFVPTGGVSQSPISIEDCPVRIKFVRGGGKMPKDWFYEENERRKHTDTSS